MVLLSHDYRRLVVRPDFALLFGTWDLLVVTFIVGRPLFGVKMGIVVVCLVKMTVFEHGCCEAGLLETRRGRKKRRLRRAGIVQMPTLVTKPQLVIDRL